MGECGCKCKISEGECKYSVNKCGIFLGFCGEIFWILFEFLKNLVILRLCKKATERLARCKAKKLKHLSFWAECVSTKRKIHTLKVRYTLWIYGYFAFLAKAQYDKEKCHYDKPLVILREWNERKIHANFVSMFCFGSPFSVFCVDTSLRSVWQGLWDTSLCSAKFSMTKNFVILSLCKKAIQRLVRCKAKKLKHLSFWAECVSTKRKIHTLKVQSTLWIYGYFAFLPKLSMTR